jgi:Lipase (class 3)
MMLALPTDAELVGCAAATYTRDDPFCDVLGSSLTIYTSRLASGLLTVDIEGTHNPLGWLLDFDALPVDSHFGFNHPDLGWVHAGFFAAAHLAFQKILPLAQKEPLAIDGHSLGAESALMVGALLIVAKLPPVKIGAFAPPRGGGSQFVRIATSVPFCAYRYDADPVPDVPFTVRPLFPYEQVPITQLPGPAIDPLDLDAKVACHHIANYVAGVAAAACPTQD